MNIAKGKVASIDYTLTNGKGEVLDSSSGQEPLAYIHGQGGLIPGLEKELEGKVKGDKLIAIIPPELAYGIHNKELVKEFPAKNFPDPDDIKIGAQFELQQDDHIQIATVTDVGNDVVTVDMNHPLADETLHFDVEVMDVREASKEELEHGHVHGAGGHHH